MSKRFILDSSELSQWHTLVQEAEQDYGCHLNEELQSYLVLTLMRFAKNKQFNSKALALDYLAAHNLPSHLHDKQLRDVGDQCLLLSGLYSLNLQLSDMSVRVIMSTLAAPLTTILAVRHTMLWPNSINSWLKALFY